MEECENTRNKNCIRIARVGGVDKNGYLIDALVPSMLDLMTGDETKQLLRAIITDLEGFPYDLVPLEGGAATVAQMLAELANVPGLDD